MIWNFYITSNKFLTLFKNECDLLEEIEVASVLGKIVTPSVFVLRLAFPFLWVSLVLNFHLFKIRGWSRQRVKLFKDIFLPFGFSLFISLLSYLLGPRPKGFHSALSSLRTNLNVVSSTFPFLRGLLVTNADVSSLYYSQ